MDNFICVHVPHSGTKIPSICKEDYVINENRLLDELLHMTDWFTDELFLADLYPAVVFPFSRLFCDVERFTDPVDEVMMAKGMGMYYTHSYDYSRIRKSPFDSEAGLMSYSYVLKVFKEHHRRLREMVEKGLNGNKNVLLVDAHSFPSIRLPYEEEIDIERPDICIGTDNVFTPPGLAEAVQQYFEKEGLKVLVNYPFSGTMVPQPFYGNKDIRVRSIMIEVNRNLYMDEATGKKKKDFSFVKNLIGGMYVLLNKEGSCKNV